MRYFSVVLRRTFVRGGAGSGAPESSVGRLARLSPHQEKEALAWCQR
jgi:hypothetical protein